MIAASPIVAEHFLKDRAWRHTKETEEEFIKATSEALEFYVKTKPETHIIIWSVYDKLPIYDGLIEKCIDIFNDYSSRKELPAKDDAARREAKIKYLLGNRI